MTCLSGGARAQKSPLPDGLTSLARERHGGVGDLTLRPLRSLMMLQRSSTIATILPHLVVLSYPSMRVIVGYIVVAAR
jgi:hypothetical protein